MKPTLMAFLALCFCLSGCGKKKEPTVDGESPKQKQTEVVDSFTGSADKDGGKHAKGIRMFFDQFPVATSSNDFAKINQLFDMSMMFRLLKKQNLVPANIKGNEERFIAFLKNLMPPVLCNPIQGIHYKRYEIRNVRFLREEQEALVYVRMWDADQIQSKMRWWLHRENGLWRAYDLEILEFSMRYSTMMGVGMKLGAEKDPSMNQFPKLNEGIALMAQGDGQKALSIFRSLKNAGFPPVLESMRLYGLSACLTDTGEFQEAILAVDKALALNSDMPMMHWVYAMCYNGLGEHEKALKHANEYADLLGKDGNYYSEVGDAYLGLGEKDQALRAYRKGIADDPKSAGFFVLDLMKVLPKGDRKEILTHYERLANLEDRFVELGEYLVGNEDADTLRTLVEVHRHFLPNDENLEFYETALKEMK